MKYKNLIFDLDGTLIDSSNGVVEAVNYSLRQMGERIQTAEKIKSYIGYPLSVMYPHFTDIPVKELYYHFQVKAAETVVSSTVLLPGVESILTELQRQGYQMAIASTKIKKHIDKIINKFNWQYMFPVFTGGDEVERVKPDPLILYETLTRLNTQPLETLVIGDTINDVLAAKAVPVDIAAVASPYGGRDKLIDAAPDYFLESLGDLINILNGERHK